MMEHVSLFSTANCGGDTCISTLVRICFDHPCVRHIYICGHGKETTIRNLSNWAHKILKKWVHSSVFLCQLSSKLRGDALTSIVFFFFCVCTKSNIKTRIDNGFY